MYSCAATAIPPLKSETTLIELFVGRRVGRWESRFLKQLSKYAFSSIGFSKTCLCSAASLNRLILPREILWVLPVLLPSL